MGNANAGVQPRLAERLTVEKPQADCSCMHIIYLDRISVSYIYKGRS